MFDVDGQFGVAESRSCLLSEPFLALLDIFIQQQSHITDDKGKNNLGKELRRASELYLQGSPHVCRESHI